MKTRVKQVSGRFFPQVKRFFTWSYFKEVDDDLDYQGYIYYKTVSFDSLEEATEFLQKQEAVYHYAN